MLPSETPRGPAAMASVTSLVALGTSLPVASSTETCGQGYILCPGALSIGCRVKASLAGAGETSNDLLAALPKPGAVASSV